MIITLYLVSFEEDHKKIKLKGTLNNKHFYIVLEVHSYKNAKYS